MANIFLRRLQPCFMLMQQNIRCSHTSITNGGVLSRIKPFTSHNFKLYPSTTHGQILHPCFCLQTRSKTKKAKAKKQKGGSSSANKVDLSIADGVIDLLKIKKEMETCVNKLQDDYKHKYTTKLTAGTIDQIPVEINGDHMHLYEMASVSSVDKEFLIKPMMNGKDITKQVLQCIQNTGLNLNPRIDGDVIRIPISIASSDYKTNLLKLCKTSADKERVHLRKIRQNGMVTLRKEKDNISQDLTRQIENQIQQLTDVHVKLIDNLLEHKEIELKT